MQTVTYDVKASRSSCCLKSVLLPSLRPAQRIWMERKSLLRSLLSSLSRLSKLQSPFRHHPEKELVESPTRSLALVFSPVMYVPQQNSRGRWPEKEGRPRRRGWVLALRVVVSGPEEDYLCL